MLRWFPLTEFLIPLMQTHSGYCANFKTRTAKNTLHKESKQFGALGKKGIFFVGKVYFYLAFVVYI